MISKKVGEIFGHCRLTHFYTSENLANGQKKGSDFRRPPAARQEKRTARSALDRGPGCVGRTVRFYRIRLLEQLLCRHGDRFGIWAAVNDFRVSVASPAQSLTTAITEGHKFTLHSDPAPGANIVCVLPMAVWKHLQLSHRHGDTEAYQGGGHPKKQRCRTYENQLPFHVRPRSS